MQQIVRRQVDHHHLVRLVEHPIRQRFADTDAGDAAHHVVQAFEVLHVDGRVDVDAGTQQLVDVLPALGMPRAGGVGVGELVDQDEVGLAPERGVEVELREPGAAVIDRLARKHLQPFEQRGGLRASMGLDHPDHYVDACASSEPGLR